MRKVKLLEREERKTIDELGKVREDWDSLGTYTIFPFFVRRSNRNAVEEMLRDYLDRIESLFPMAECGYLIDCVRGVYHFHIYYRGVYKKELEQDCLFWENGYYCLSDF